MKYLLSLFLIITTIALHANDGSSNWHYVWAKNGLNLRSAPGTHQSIVGQLSFGDSLIILRETEVSYNIVGIQKVDTVQYYYSRYERKEPYILYGKWVEVLTSSGQVAYVIDQYLLRLRPSKIPGINLEQLERDTVEITEAGWTQKFKRKRYRGGITSYDYINEKGYEESFNFPGYTIQEVFIILTSHLDLQDQAIIYQNWKESLKFFDNGICSFEINQKEGYVLLSWQCYC